MQESPRIEYCEALPTPDRETQATQSSLLYSFGTKARRLGQTSNMSIALRHTKTDWEGPMRAPERYYTHGKAQVCSARDVGSPRTMTCMLLPLWSHNAPTSKHRQLALKDKLMTKQTGGSFKADHLVPLRRGFAVLLPDGCSVVCRARHDLLAIG